MTLIDKIVQEKLTMKADKRSCEESGLTMATNPFIAKKKEYATSDERPILL